MILHFFLLFDESQKGGEKYVILVFLGENMLISCLIRAYLLRICVKCWSFLAKYETAFDSVLDTDLF
jgi:hypothetical protein